MITTVYIIMLVVFIIEICYTILALVKRLYAYKKLLITTSLHVLIPILLFLLLIIWGVIDPPAPQIHGDALGGEAFARGMLFHVLSLLSVIVTMTVGIAIVIISAAISLLERKRDNTY
jgi:hypothetical protein